MINLLVKNAWPVINRGLTLILSVLGITIVAPYLGPEQFGMFAAMQSIAAWAVLANLGMIEANSAILTKFSTQCRPKQAASYIWISFVANLVCAACLFLLLVGIMFWFLEVHKMPNETILAFLLVVGLSVLSAPFGLAQSIQNAAGQTNRIAGWALVQGAAYLGVVLFMTSIDVVFDKQRLILIAGASGGVMFVTRFAMFFSANRDLFLRPLWSAHLSVRRFRSLARQSYPYIIVNIAALMAFQTDRLVTLYLFTPADVARIDVVMKLFSALYTVYGILIAGLWKAVGARWNDRDLGGLRKLICQSVSASLVFWLFVTACSPFFVEKVVQYWTRNTITIGDSFLILAAAASVGLRATVDITSVALFAMRKQHKTTLVVVLHGVLNIPMAILFGHLFGLVGIIIGQMFSLAITSAWYFPLLLLKATTKREV